MVISVTCGDVVMNRYQLAEDGARDLRGGLHVR
eukprot:COSAG01_NODE_952_length_12499_cov_84.157661_13_plen_33_part_00